MASELRACTKCGCTVDRACAGGCAWASAPGEPPVCSSCASLHVFKFEDNSDILILSARDLDDAWAVILEHLGLDRADCLGADMAQLVDDEELTLGDDEGEPQTLQCREWAVLMGGRGLLGSTDV